MRPGWLIAGSVLWLLVAVMAFAIVRNRPAGRDEEEADEEGSGPAAIVIGQGGLPNGRAPIIAKPVDSDEPYAGWDPKGIQEFTLTERSGKMVTKEDLLGHPFVVCFIFTRCAGPCFQVSSSMARLHEALKGTDVRLVTITVDPKRDTPEDLRKYADGLGADDRWLFLTGSQEKIYDLTLKSFLMPVEEMTGERRKPGWEVLHTTNILLVDERGVVQEKYDGRKPDEVQKLIDRLTGPAVAEIPGEKEATVPGDGDAPEAEAAP